MCFCCGLSLNLETTTSWLAQCYMRSEQAMNHKDGEKRAEVSGILFNDDGICSFVIRPVLSVAVTVRFDTIYPEVLTGIKGNFT